jgi:hypothetical protein
MQAGLASSTQLYRCLILTREQLNESGKLRWIFN